ncbi:YpiB family protein [Macrococcus animalis]|uniref:YpiB family protein n=2 Tax=Macrococcus animalis TaxID=3395467 RepID=UPI0039BDF720
MNHDMIETRSAFIKYLLHQYDIHDKNTVWLLNLIKDKDNILEQLQFKKTTHLSDQLIIFKNFKVHLILSHGIYTDSDVIFHYLLKNEHRLYVNILFSDMKYDTICQQELMHQINFLVMDEHDLRLEYIETKIDLYELLTHQRLFQYIIDQIILAIEDTLITKNESRFAALSQLKKDLEEKRNHVI